MNTKIVKLTAENVKRLSAVEITPDGSLVVIGGNNAQGKSSVLDSIMYALAGGKTLPTKPVRDGQEKAAIEVDLGDILVKRTFTAAGGSTLTVTNKADGIRIGSPQAMLDTLVGRLTFDPLDFSRQKDQAQAETLRALVGIDFTQLNTERQRIYDERTAVGREVTSLKSRLSAIPIPDPGLPDAEQSTADILKQQSDAANRNAARERERSDAKTERTNADSLATLLKNLESEINRMERDLADKKREMKLRSADLVRANESAEMAERHVATLINESLGAFALELTRVEEVNAKVRAAISRQTLATELEEKEVKYRSLTASIDGIDTTKVATISKAKFPVAGLSFDTDGNVIFNKLPFSQASSAEQLRVSIAIGIALNPTLRVLLIRDGSLLDATNLQLIREMATATDSQVWIEVVSTGGEVSVVIEDGAVKA